jgi:hypothetical protein
LTPTTTQTEEIKMRKLSGMISPKNLVVGDHVIVSVRLAQDSTFDAGTITRIYEHAPPPEEACIYHTSPVTLCEVEF